MAWDPKAEAKRLAALKSRITAETEISRLTREQVDDLKLALDVERNRGTMLGKNSAAGKEIVKNAKEALQGLRDQVRERERLNIMAEEHHRLTYNEVDALSAGEERLQKRADMYDAEIEAIKTRIKLEHDPSVRKNQEDQIKNLEKQRDLLIGAGSAAEEMGKSIGNALKIKEATNMQAAFQKVQKAMAGGSDALAIMGKAAAWKAVWALADGMAGLAIATYDVEQAFKRTTGASDEMARSLTEGYAATLQYGVTLESMRGTMEALKGAYTDFTMLNTGQAKEIAKTGAVLERLGVSSAEFAKGMQVSTKMLGLSADQAAKTQLELRALAVDIGVDPKQMAADFANAGSQLAKFGSQGTKAMKDLAIASKITGMEVSKILGMVEKFDTFEGAATQAGKLNAALGGNFVNAMDLMMETDPVARFEMIRDSISDAGLSFDDMSYYQKQFYKDALGLSEVGDLAMALRGDMSSLDGQVGKTSDEYAAAAAQAQELQGFTELLKNTLKDMIPVVTPLVTAIGAFFKMIAKNKAIMWGFVIIIGLLMAKIALIPMIILAVVFAIGKLIEMVTMDVGHSTIIDVFTDTLPDAFDKLRRIIMTLREPFSSLISWIGNAGKALFSDNVGASTFLEGVGKIGHAFDEQAIATDRAGRSTKVLSRAVKDEQAITERGKKASVALRAAPTAAAAATAGAATAAARAGGAAPRPPDEYKVTLNLTMDGKVIDQRAYKMAAEHFEEITTGALRGTI